MSNRLNGLILKYWRQIYVATALVGAAGTAAVLGAFSRDEPSVAEEPLEVAGLAPTPTPIPAEALPALPDAYGEPRLNHQERVRTYPPGGPFSYVSEYAPPQQGFYKDDAGFCYGAYGKSPAEMAADIEADLGARVAGYSGFADGMIVEFRDGDKIAVWQKEIDCKDPPYNPIPRRNPAE